MLKYSQLSLKISVPEATGFLMSGPVNEKFKFYFEPIDSSILAIRDIAREPKYLVVGAPWDIILVRVSSIPIKVTSKETIETRAGTFDTFILSYKIGLKSRI